MCIRDSALACDPEVLLLDEPLGAVDFQMRQLLQKQLKQMLQAKKTTALMVTHDVDEAVYLSDRVIEMCIRDSMSLGEYPINRPMGNPIRQAYSTPVSTRLIVIPILRRTYKSRRLSNTL